MNSETGPHLRGSPRQSLASGNRHLGPSGSTVSASPSLWGIQAWTVPGHLSRKRERSRNDLCHPYLGRRHHRNLLEVIVRHAGGGKHEETWRLGGPDFRCRGWAGLPSDIMSDRSLATGLKRCVTS